MPIGFLLVHGSPSHIGLLLTFGSLSMIGFLLLVGSLLLVGDLVALRLAFGDRVLWWSTARLAMLGY
jgi:uncharacterized membrane protein YgdD (TMEM256/DUF423 family)